MKPPKKSPSTIGVDEELFIAVSGSERMIQQFDLFTTQRCGSITDTPMGVVEVVLAGRVIETFTSVKDAVAWAEQRGFAVLEGSRLGVVVEE